LQALSWLKPCPAPDSGAAFLALLLIRLGVSSPAPDPGAGQPSLAGTAASDAQDFLIMTAIVTAGLCNQLSLDVNSWPSES